MSAGTTPRRITVVGAGTVGTNLALALHRRGHEVRFAARDPESPRVRAAVEALGAAEGHRVVGLDAAGDDTDVVILAVPGATAVEAARALGELSDTILVDVTNAVGSEPPDGHATVLDAIASVQPRAVLVKAFNTIGAEAYLAPQLSAGPAFLPIAGDADGTAVVRDLADDLGFDAIVVGGRTDVGLLEDAARLWIHLAFRTGLGRDFGFVRSSR